MREAILSSVVIRFQICIFDILNTAESSERVKEIQL